MKIFESRFPWIFTILMLVGALALSPWWGRGEETASMASRRSKAKIKYETVDLNDDVVTGGQIVSTQTLQNHPTTTTSAPGVGPSVPEDVSCQCEIREEKFRRLTYETPRECGSDRNYLQEPLRRFKSLDRGGVFTRTRNLQHLAHRLPRKCLLFAMKHTFPPVFKKEIFGLCGRKIPTESDPTDFHRTSFKPCVTEELVNVVYNSYLDATECFDVPAKFAVAKFMNESGVIPNTVASNNDAGLSQFSTGAMEILKTEYEKWSGEMRASRSQACANLMNYPGAMPASEDEIVAEDPKKCQLVQMPPNPVRNFIYYGVYYHIINRDVQNFLNRTTRTLLSGQADPSFVATEVLMKQARITHFDRKRIAEILAIMAYNTGPKAVTYFKEWLAYRNAKFAWSPITAADLDMTISPNPWAGFEEANRETMLAAYEQGGQRAMKFWEWLAVNKNKFRYASYVKFYSDRLDSNMGVGVCTPPRFLEM